MFFTEFSAERRRIARALRASEERFRTLVEFSCDVYWETDAQHRFTRLDSSEPMRNAPTPSVELGKTRWEISHLEPDAEGWRKHRAMLDAHLPFKDFEISHPTAASGVRYISASGVPLFDDLGRFVGYRGVDRDISELKRAEAEHRAHSWFLESMDRIHRAMQATYDVEVILREVLGGTLEIFACDRVWLCYPCDAEVPAWRVVMEQSRPEWAAGIVRGRDVPMTPHAADAVRAALAAEGAVPAGAGHPRAVRPDIAEEFGVRSEMLMALRPQGDRAYLLGLHQCSGPRTWSADEQRLFEEIGHRLAATLSNLIAFRTLRESESRLESAQRVAHIGWWERDYETQRVSLSEETCRIFGVEPVDLPHWQGRWLSLIHPEERARVAAASDAALAGGARYDIEYRVVRPDGEVRIVHSQGDVIRDELGRALRQFGVMQDITELRQAEFELRAKDDALQAARAEIARVSRLTTLGELTTSIAHEVSQPLGAIVASAGACTRWLDADPPAMAQAQAALANIVADGKRARDVIARIRALSKRQEPRKESLDINQEITSVLKLTERELRSQGIVLHTELRPALPRLTGDRVQLQQVLLNLILNAIEAMSAVEDRARELTIVSRQDAADAVLIEVRDCGHGLDPQNAEQVFEAFYTTKPDGIGIGLSISRSIIEAHGGRLWASANAPYGAVFQFSLPVADERDAPR